MHGLRTAQPDQGSHTGFPAHHPGPAQNEDRTRPRLPLAVADPITKRGLDDDQRHSCLERWGHILSRLNGLSPITQAWQDSQRPDQLLELSLRRFSTTTLTPT